VGQSRYHPLTVIPFDADEMENDEQAVLDRAPREKMTVCQSRTLAVHQQRHASGVFLSKTSAVQRSAAGTKAAQRKSAILRVEASKNKERCLQ
jgi:hypothetical protein